MKSTEVIIAVDSREQRPYHFQKFEVKTLESGDYSVVGLEDRIAIELKPRQMLTRQ